IHGPTAPDRETVAVDPDHIDIACTPGDPLLEYAGSLIDHRIDQPLDDLFLADHPALDTDPRGSRHDQRLDLAVRARCTRARLVEIEALAGLLPETTGLA